MLIANRFYHSTPYLHIVPYTKLYISFITDFFLFVVVVMFSLELKLKYSGQAHLMSVSAFNEKRVCLCGCVCMGVWLVVLVYKEGLNISRSFAALHICLYEKTVCVL